MDLEVLSPSKSSVKCCNCGSSCSNVVIGSHDMWLRSVKRKYDEYEKGNRFFLPGFDYISTAKVEIENECDALRETVSSQQQTIQDLSVELEEERNAAASAANEAMSMILRLQREKAEIQMEARQFKRFVEERLAHDQQEISSLEDVLYKREQAIQALTCELQAYKHRIMSFGLTGDEAEEFGLSRNSSMRNIDSQIDLPGFEYPPLRCSLNENHGPFGEGDDDVEDVEKYAFGDTPRGREHLMNLESRIYQMERSPSYSQADGDSSSKNVVDKLIVGHSPRKFRHSRKFSADSSGSFFATIRETGPEFTESPRRYSSFRKTEFISQTDDNSRKVENSSEVGDEMSDRVYTIDSVYNGVPYDGVAGTKGGVGAYDDYVSTPKQSFSYADIADPDIKKLYMRLHALEADRETMRQALISVGTDKAQMVLLKEIAQHLCKEAPPERRMPMKKASALGSLSFLSVFKWIASFVFWRKKARRSKHMFGFSANNPGLLMLIDKSPRMRQWRCLSSTQV